MKQNWEMAKRIAPHDAFRSAQYGREAAFHVSGKTEPRTSAIDQPKPIPRNQNKPTK